MSPHEDMLSRVAVALGPDMVSRTAFVGGCATAVLVTDELAKQGIRYTDDVDVIVHIVGRGSWYRLEKELSNLGFYNSGMDDVVCRLRLRDERGELIVDFMPDDEKILGFSNKWYAEALDNAEVHIIQHSGIEIRVVSSPYFLGTKLEAYRGRGKNDPMGSRDVEDILSVIDGRDTLEDEITKSEPELIGDIAKGIRELLSHRDIDYVIQSFARGSSAREESILARMERIAAM